MIAYNHYIRFVPEIDSINIVENTFLDKIIIKETLNYELPKNLNYELSFINNQGRDNFLRTDREFNLTEHGQLWEFEVEKIVTFFWYSGNLTINYIPHEKYSSDLLKYWVLHIVIPLYFTIEEKYDFLHAGAVEVEGNPILFIAESMGGKSTITDFFLKQGHTLISDDKVGTYQKNNDSYAVSSHPHHRPYRKVEDLGLFVENFAISSKPIYALYELEKSKKDAIVKISEVKGMEKLRSLRLASEINLFFQKPKRFEYLVLMANNISLYKVTIPWDINRLKDVYEKIIEHIRKLEREKY